MGIKLEELKNEFYGFCENYPHLTDLLDKEGYYHEFELNEMKCMMLRNKLGAWCGYVSIDKKHELYKNSDLVYQYAVYGGITYSGFLPINNGDLFWIGFDCSHYDDSNPISRSFNIDKYKNYDFVYNELDLLSKQLYKKSFKCKIKMVLNNI